jgi:flagellar hook-associated protein 1 FlgK
MPDIAGILNIGRQALSAHQRAISVTSGNIANVNTPGYSRQQPLYETTSILDGVFGSGVQIAQVRSVVDTFLERQIITGQSTLGRFQAEKGLMDRIEDVFNNGGNGIHQAINDFFSAVNDLSDDAAETAPRVVLLERARGFAQTVRAVDTQLKSISKDMDAEIRGRVDEVNQLALQIADLNKTIQLADHSSDASSANGLKDERTRLLGALSEKVQINLLEGENGAVTVTVGGGGETATLISGGHADSLSASMDAQNSGRTKISLRDGRDITGSIGGGRLGGLIEIRDNVLSAYTDKLDKLAASIAVGFNTQHAKGFALDGTEGGDFFSPLNLSVSEPSTNNGGASMLVAIDEAQALTFDPYEITFSQGQFTIRNVKTGASTADFTATAFGFTAVFEGIAIEIAGDASDGDRFDIAMPYQGQAGKMDVVLSDPALIAASDSAEALPGGNGNALLLAQLQDKSFSALGDTLQDFYAGFTAEVGSRARLSQQNLAVEEGIADQLATKREEVSGVSLDEEMTNLISFQRAYQASARLITTADELLQTIIEMKR